MDLNELPAKAGPALVFMLAVWFLSLTVRRIVEHVWPRLADKKTWWTDIALPCLPYALGVALAVGVRKFPGLAELPSHGTRALYGLAGGALSGLVYRIVKAVAKSKYGVELSMPPDAVQGAQVLVNVPKSELPKIDVHYPGKSENEEVPNSDAVTEPDLEAPKVDKS